jgi:hypothetical protein
MIVQQFTYPTYLFGATLEGTESLYGSDYSVEIRTGIYRYWLHAYFLVPFAGLYSWIRFNDSENKWYLAFFVFCCIGIYMNQSRFEMFCFLICIVLSLRKNKLGKVTASVMVPVTAVASFLLGWFLNK